MDFLSSCGTALARCSIRRRFFAPVPAVPGKWVPGRAAGVRAVALGLLVATLAACGPGASTAQPGAADQAHAAEHAHDRTQEALVQLTPEQLEALGIQLATAGPGTLALTKSFPGTVKLNDERHAHVVARVPGVAASVAASAGQVVQAGQTLAVLESRELARATAEYLGAREQAELARDYFARIDSLHTKGIATEREQLQARQALAEAEIELQAGRHGLRALGFSPGWIEALPDAAQSARFRYPLRAPIDGMLIRRHLTRGEAVPAEAEAFEIADLSSVWVELDIFPEDLAHVREGQTVTITAGGQRSEGTIAWLRPIVAEDTRAALARVVLANPERSWKPGMYVDGRVALDNVQAPLVVQSSALQTIEGQSVVFVQTADGFAPRAVEVGAQGPDKVAIEAGLTAGARYVVEGAFTLKAELAKGSFEAGHSH